MYNNVAQFTAFFNAAHEHLAPLERDALVKLATVWANEGIARSANVAGSRPETAPQQSSPSQ